MSIRCFWGLVLFALLCLGAETRRPWSDGPVEVTRVYLPGILHIRRGRAMAPLRIRGVQTVGRRDGNLLTLAKRDVEAWVSKGNVQLHGSVWQGENLSGSLRLQNGFLLSTELIRNGYALVQLNSTNSDLARSVQFEARLRKRGLWDSLGLEPHEASELEGRFARICGDISGINRTQNRDGMIYLGGDYPRSDLTIHIPAAAEPLFGRFENVFLNRRICVVGLIGSRGPWTETIVYDPTQIRDSGRSLQH